MQTIRVGANLDAVGVQSRVHKKRGCVHNEIEEAEVGSEYRVGSTRKVYKHTHKIAHLGLIGVQRPLA